MCPSYGGGPPDRGGIATEPANLFAALPALETERLLLRPSSTEDAADVFAYARDPEVARHTTWEPHASIDDARDFIATRLERQARGEPAPWALVLKIEGRVVGDCGFTSWVPRHNRAEIAYNLARPLWGRGLMPEAVRRAVAFGFEVIGCNRIEARCLPENAASARVLEKAGMTCEGVIREQMYVKGAYRSLRLYSILRREWSPQP